MTMAEEPFDRVFSLNVKAPHFFVVETCSADGSEREGGNRKSVAAVQVAMIAGLPYTALRDAILTHPTLAEGLIPLFSSAASVHSVADATATRVSA